MKFPTIFLAVAAQLASAHYFFETNIINGVTQTPGKYVRDTTRQTKYNPIKFSSNPSGDIRDGSHADGPDIRCNQGAFSNAGRTEVLTVNAGSEVTAKLAYGAKMEHPGRFYRKIFYMRLREKGKSDLLCFQAPASSTCLAPRAITSRPTMALGIGSRSLKRGYVALPSHL